MNSFLVCEFGKPSISSLVSECFGSEFPEILAKRQLDYISRYLKGMGAKSVVLEREYIDKDYLDDFSKFYFKRFNSREHRCARIHFFSEPWTHPNIEGMLQSHKEDKTSQLQESYLGFLVVKPLPKTFIGRTCLKIHPDIPAALALKREYSVNLFGIDLKVESVAFQEQDKVVSACATTAIWSSLHAADWIPLQSIPSCSQITTNAINFIEGSSNNFPNKELTNKQMLRAIDVAGYRHHQHLLINTNKKEALDFIKCYLRSGLPLVLGGNVFDLANEETKSLGDHAVAIVAMREDAESTYLFVHDDRIGPFARAKIIDHELDTNQEIDSALRKANSWKLSIEEKNEAGEWSEKEHLIPKSLIAITNKKVGLPLSLCINTCDRLLQLHEFAVKETQKTAPTSDSTNLTYDIYLSDISTIKRSILAEPALNLDEKAAEKMASEALLFDLAAIRLSTLTTSLSKRHWKATFFYNSEPALAILFDATDIAQGDAIVAVYPLQAGAYAYITVMLKKIANNASSAILGRDDNFIASFLRRISSKSEGRNQYLDKTFGSSRAPTRIKPEEYSGGDIQKNPQIRAYYGSSAQELKDIYPELMQSRDNFAIWVIDMEGTLLIGIEIKGLGHPTLTGFKPARIGGELKYNEGKWFINSKSGRYSRNYSDAETETLLNNALEKFKQIFYKSRESLEAAHFKSP
ncbi:hypothetical protein FHT03_003535 [Xanthomonas arboricola]